MHTFRQSGRTQTLLLALGALAALAALMVFGVGHAGAKAKEIKYAGTSTKASGTKLTLEGPEGKKGPWPWIVTATLTNATATCPIESGVEVPYKFTEKFSEFPIEVSLKGSAHPGNPNFHRSEQFTTGSETEEGKYATTETSISGELTPNGKKGRLAVDYTFTVSPTAIGSKEAEPVCHYEDAFTFQRVK
jgi:hypothetical protein